MGDLIRERHVPDEAARDSTGYVMCAICPQVWPCDADLLLRERDAERARTVVLAEALRNAANWLTPVPGRPYCACTDSGLCLAHAHVEEIRAALAVLPVDRVGVEPLDVEQGWALHGYPVVLYQEPEDGSWSVLAPDLPGFVAADMTIGGALHEAEDAMAVWLAAWREDHGDAPTPSDPHSWPRPPHPYRSKYDDPDLRFSGGCVSCGVTADSHARLIESPTEGEMP